MVQIFVKKGNQNFMQCSSRKINVKVEVKRNISFDLMTSTREKNA